MRVILDTGVFFFPEALDMLRWYAAPLIVPAVVYAERRRQLAKAQVDPDEFDALLAEIGAAVEPLGAAEAARYTSRLVDDDEWKRLARDAFIAGHIGPDDRILTTNPRDFTTLGVPALQVVEIPAWRAKERRQGREATGRGASRRT